MKPKPDNDIKAQLIEPTHLPADGFYKAIL